MVTADTGFVLSRDPDTVLAPDVAFVRADRLPPPGQRHRFAELAPDLAVEVVSPDRATDVTEKTLRYLDAGVALVWVVYPAQRTVAVHHAGGEMRLVGDDGVLDGGGVLPGLALAVRDLLE